MPEGQFPVRQAVSESSEFHITRHEDMTCGIVIPYPENHEERAAKYGKIVCGMEYGPNPDDIWFFQCINCRSKKL
ncbi:MAG: hypothetical protein VX492_03445 [Candidatus Thermoplasmatota archaeon]|nr:hypothetical protein [Candidatus Thermoplasmatota archaeon]